MNTTEVKEIAMALIRVCRWVTCFPVAMSISFLVWLGSTSMFPRVTYGLSPLSRIGLTPIVLRTALPACAFVVAGVLMAPGRGRKVCFVFFALGLLFSGGSYELLSNGGPETPNPTLWAAAMVGIVLGSLVGLWGALELQCPRSLRPAPAGDGAVGSRLAADASATSRSPDSK